MPTNGIKSPNNAKLGIVWMIPATCKPASPQNGRSRKLIAKGTAIKIAITNEISEIVKCAPVPVRSQCVAH